MQICFSAPNMVTRLQKSDQKNPSKNCCNEEFHVESYSVMMLETMRRVLYEEESWKEIWCFYARGWSTPHESTSVLGCSH